MGAPAGTGIRGDWRRQKVPRRESRIQAGTAVSSPGSPGETWEQWAGSMRSHLHTLRTWGLVVKPGEVLAAFTPRRTSTPLTVRQNPQGPFR